MSLNSFYVQWPKVCVCFFGLGFFWGGVKIQVIYIFTSSTWKINCRGYFSIDKLYKYPQINHKCVCVYFYFIFCFFIYFFLFFIYFLIVFFSMFFFLFFSFLYFLVCFFFRFSFFFNTYTQRRAEDLCFVDSRQSTQILCRSTNH